MPRKPFYEPHAFAAWAAMGEGRALSTIATRFGVSLTRIERVAEERHWQERLDAVEGKDSPAAALQAEVSEMDARHLKMARAIQGKALEVLLKMPLRSTEAAVRALDVAMSQERSVRDRQARGQRLKLQADPARVQIDRMLIEESKAGKH